MDHLSSGQIQGFPGQTKGGNRPGRLEKRKYPSLDLKNRARCHPLTRTETVGRTVD